MERSQPGVVQRYGPWALILGPSEGIGAAFVEKLVSLWREDHSPRLRRDRHYEFRRRGRNDGGSRKKIMG